MKHGRERRPVAPKNRIVGVDSGEGTPVPIPNTEVKLTCADNTWLATAREDKKMPTQNKTPSDESEGVLFCVIPANFAETNGYTVEAIFVLPAGGRGK